MFGLGLGLGLQKHKRPTDGGGGGGDPAWVPEGSAWYVEPRIIDGFGTGRAWTQADGIVGVDALLGSDPDSVNWWGATQYKASCLTADGLTGDGSGDEAPALIGAAKSAISTGQTIVIEVLLTETLSAYQYILHNSDGSNSIVLQQDNADLYLYFSPVNTQDSEIEDILNFIDAPVRNRIAITLSPSRCEFSANGSPAVDLDLTTDEWPSGAAGMATAVLPLTGGWTIVSVTGYALKAVGELPALSMLP